MKLRGIQFGNILAASGVQGFFGEGYWFHKPWHFLGLDFKGMTFVSKTATLFPRKGNMALTKNFTPKYPFPRCVRVKPFREVVLNSVGLSNPGLLILLGLNKWQKINKPFLISIMSTAETKQKRIDEFKIMTEMIGSCDFSAPFGVQINLSCPNTGHNPNELIKESFEVLDITSRLGVPVMPKYSIASAPIKAILELDKHPHCDAICVSNTLPFDWKKSGELYWGTKISPLADIGGGGISGKPLKMLVCNWIRILREDGFIKPINGGGGILYNYDVAEYNRAGASSIFIGSAAILGPWRIKSIINFANTLTWLG